MATILAVDDSASMRQMVSFTLKGAGYDVIEASEGVSAIYEYEYHKNNLDLIVTDYFMPDMDGISLAKEFFQRGNHTPIFLLTGYGNFDRTDAAGSGIHGWISKPFIPESFVMTVHAATTPTENSKN